MISAAKLVRQLRAALAVEEENAPWESFAADYVRLCEEANRRLESCAAMLDNGSEYQALQLAESEPALLDSIAALSFAELPEWTEFCTANQLPIAPKFDPQAVQALDRLYAKGITASHPLYKDYRAAVTSRDDSRAVQIIRSIVRLNPDDANAKSELARIENKLYQVKLQELRAALGRNDEEATLPALGELERLATPARLAEAPEYARAVAVRRQVERREATEVAERLAESLPEEREAGAWRMVGDLLARIKALQAEHGFQLPAALAGRCAEMQTYYDAQRATFEEGHRFQQAVNTAGGLAESTDLRLLGGSTLTIAEAEGLHTQLSTSWKEVERFGRAVPDEVVRKVRTSAAALQAELSRVRRQRRGKLVLAGAGLLVALGAGAWFTVTTIKANEFARQLADLREGGQVEPAEKLAAQLRTDHSALAHQPKLSARLAEVDRWTQDERAKLEDLDHRLSALEQAASTKFAQADPVEVAGRLQTADRLTDDVALGLRSAPASRLVIVRNDFERHLKDIRAQLVADAERELATLDDFANHQLSYEGTKQANAEILARIGPPLKVLESRVAPPIPELALPPALQVQVGAIRKQADLFQKELAVLDHAREAVTLATSLETFLQALAEYKVSRLSQEPEVIAARQVLATPPNLNELLASLLLPDDPIAWAAAKADVTGASLMPDTVLKAELSLLIAVRGDANLKDIWEATLIDHAKKNAKHTVYARAAFTTQTAMVGDAQATVWAGKVHDPAEIGDVPSFRDRQASPFRLTRTSRGTVEGVELADIKPNSDAKCLTQLELDRMTDTDGEKFVKPLLRVFSDLVADKAASPLCKGYLMQQLGSLLKMRPYAWGLEYCTSLRDDLAELARLSDGPLRSGDWLLDRKKAQYEAKLAKFFSGLQGRNYLAEARFRRELLRSMLKAGLQYGGHLDVAGVAHLLPEARNNSSLWVLQPGAQKLQRYQTAPAPAPAAPFSPIFYVPLDAAKLLAEAKRSSGAPAGKTGIPWLDGP